MGSSKMTDLVIFGTELEELDDEEKDVVSRRPIGVQEQVVRDEKGRRRFHGAFTGGFSAGYFNTVGSKEGWQPKQFCSSRNERGERFQQVAEDFMDEEDVGEFGIASRRMHAALDDGLQRGNQRLAWERSDQSALDASLASRIESLVRPVRESMGVRLLKKMGWREGQGIGLKMSRRALEKHKQNELRARGHVGKFNEEAVKEAEEMAPGFEFAPEDVLSHYLHSRDGTKGLGYEGLRKSDVLSERYGVKEASLKVKQKSKGIRGQAFGVGAFEDDDESIYTNYDLSQYDFAIGGNDTPSTSTYSYDSTFVMAEKRQGARPFFEPPRLPHNFRPIHRPILIDVSLLPNAVRKFGEKMTHVQRAKFLGEVDKNAVMELIRDEDRKRLTGRAISTAEPKKDFDENMFEDEPMKQARFKQYVQYLKRGLNFPQPIDMTSLEWERELAEFQRILPPHLRSLLPEVKARQVPLASADLAIPIAQILKSKFTPSSAERTQRRNEVKDEDRLAAVRMKMFGEMTRQSHEWHPVKQLCKRFNVPDPYPSSTLVGVPCLQKAMKMETLLNLGTTQQELQYRAERTRHTEATEEANKHTIETEVGAAQGKSNDEKGEEKIEKPPEDFFKAIFAESDDESDKGEMSEEEYMETLMDEKTKEAVEKEQNETAADEQPKPKFVTVMDLVKSDDEEFGPAPPPPSSEPSLSAFSVVRQHQNSKEGKQRKREKKRRKRRDKEKSKESRHKKHSKRRKYGRSSSDSRSSSVIWTD